MTTEKLLEFWPAWLAIAIAVAATLNQAIQESEKLANILGGWARKINARAKKRYRMDTVDFNKAVREAVNDERLRWEQDETRALAAVEGQMKYVTKIAEDQQKELSDLNFRVRCMTSYTEYEADWHHRMRMLILRADTNGGHLPLSELPDHMHYADFERQCRERSNTNWRSWKIL